MFIFLKVCIFLTHNALLWWSIVNRYYFGLILFFDSSTLHLRTIFARRNHHHIFSFAANNNVLYNNVHDIELPKCYVHYFRACVHSALAFALPVSPWLLTLSSVHVMFNPMFTQQTLRTLPLQRTSQTKHKHGRRPVRALHRGRRAENKSTR